MMEVYFVKKSVLRIMSRELPEKNRDDYVRVVVDDEGKDRDHLPIVEALSRVHSHLVVLAEGQDAILRAMGKRGRYGLGRTTEKGRHGAAEGQERGKDGE